MRFLVQCVVPEADDTVWYFAYGSNMHPAIFVERRRIQPLAVRAARLDGYRLSFGLPIGPGERGVATLEPEPAARVWGVVYRISRAHSDHLDRTEGVPWGVYARLAVELMAEDGERMPAFTYRSLRTVAGRKPSARYLGLLVEGARRHGLPAEYVRFLEGLELAWDERPGALNR